MRRMLLCAVLALGACGSGTDDPETAATTTTERVTTTTDPRYGLTAQDWASEERTAAEDRYGQATSLAFGIATNPDKMLEYGYDLCEMYAESDASRADVIQDWATEEGQPVGVASTLGAAATDHLCPD